MRPNRVIDIHPHVLSPDTNKYPRKPVGGTQSTWSAQRALTGDQLVADMDAAGIDGAAVVQASTAYGHDNSYLADCVAAYPRRLVAVCSVDPTDTNITATLARFDLSGKVAGARLFVAGSTVKQADDWADAVAVESIWRWAGETATPVNIQLTREGLCGLRRMMDRYPQTIVVLDHLAFPDLTEGHPYASSAWLFDLARYEQLYLKLSTEVLINASAGHSRPGDFLRTLTQYFDAGRIAWGSNYPASKGSLPDLLGQAMQAISSGTDKIQIQKIFHGTAERLYPSLVMAEAQ